MAKGKRKNPTNRNQDHSPSSERSTPTPPSPGHPNTTENLDPDLKTFLMMMIEDIKKDFHKSLKELQESTAKELQALKEKQENTAKQVMEMNKTILELKGEVDTIKKTQSEATLEIETLGKRSILAILTGVKWNLRVVLICISLIDPPVVLCPTCMCFCV